MSIIKLAATKKQIDNYNANYAKIDKQHKGRKAALMTGGALAVGSLYAGVMHGGNKLIGHPALPVKTMGVLGLAVGAGVGNTINRMKIHKNMPKSIRTKIVPEDY